MEVDPPCLTSVPEWGIVSDQKDFEALLDAVLCGHASSGAISSITSPMITTTKNAFNSGALAKLYALARSKEVRCACLTPLILLYPSYTPLTPLVHPSYIPLTPIS
jgi:hypothetical protein